LKKSGVQLQTTGVVIRHTGNFHAEDVLAQIPAKFGNH